MSSRLAQPEASRSVAPSIALSHGCGVRLWSVSGDEYLDLFGGAGVCVLGHGDERFAEQVSGQLRKIAAARHELPVRAEARSRVEEHLPGGLGGVVLVSSGGEAIDLALRLGGIGADARVVAFEEAYHGRVGASRALSDPVWRRRSEGEAGSVFRVPFPMCPEELDGLESSLEEVGDFDAVVVEPVQGTAGNRFPAAGFLGLLRERADQQGAILVIDECVTGGGRTGSMLASADSVDPDIVVLGKGLGNGLPVGAVALAEDLAQSCSAEPVSTTFGGNPLTCAAICAVLDRLEEGLGEEVAAHGRAWLRMLREGLADLGVVGAVRGEGLLIGIELRSPRSGGKLSREEEVSALRLLATHGLLVGIGNSRIRLNPPLVFGAEEAEVSTAGLVAGLAAFEGGGG